MQARRIARELALLSISQLPAQPAKLEAQQLQDMILAAVRTLTTEAHEALETAAAELKRGRDRLLGSEIRTTDVQGARTMVDESIGITQTAINRLGMAIELPELIQLSNRQEVRSYTLQLLSMVTKHQPQIDQTLSASLVDWQLSRLARIDRDILRVAVAEILFLGVPDRVAINEAVELAKRYSGEEGHRFINGVLRRVTDYLKQPATPENSVAPSAETTATEETAPIPEV